MFDPDTIESQLRKLDADWQATGQHLSDEDIAAVIDGQPLSKEQARHLLGCRECSEFLREIATSFSEAPSVVRRPRPPALTRPRPPQSRRRASAAWAIVLLAAVSFAGLRYFDGRIWNESAPTSSSIEPPVRVDTAPRLDGSQGRTSGDLESGELSSQPSETVDVNGPHTMEDAATGSNVRVEPVTRRTHASDSETTDSKKPFTNRVDSRNGSQESSHVDSKAPRTSSISKGPGRGQTAAKIDLTVGEHRSVQARVKDKSDERHELSTSRLQSKRTQRRMTREPVAGPSRGFGQLRLASKPAARVLIDGRVRGWTPIIDLRLQAGPHDVTLVYDSPYAAEPEQKFRVLIRADETWATVRDNRLRKVKVKAVDAAPSPEEPRDKAPTNSVEPHLP